MYHIWSLPGYCVGRYGGHGFSITKECNRSQRMCRNGTTNCLVAGVITPMLCSNCIYCSLSAIPSPVPMMVNADENAMLMLPNAAVSAMLRQSHPSILPRTMLIVTRNVLGINEGGNGDKRKRQKKLKTGQSPGIKVITKPSDKPRLLLKGKIGRAHV